MVFPARAGMSRSVAPADAVIKGVPRASGDEPTNAVLYSEPVKCSPRERG